ncbi:MAG: diguanylate cyclase [Spirochaetales bacterium]|nr:diguanylate cyclase [Spirochaetales bacterium]
MTILHLELSKAFREVVQDMAHQLGLEYVGVPSQTEALAFLEKKNPAGIITGMELLDSTGPKFLQALNGTDHKSIPTLVVTGDDSLTTRESLYSMGIADYIRKSDLTYDHLRRYLESLNRDEVWIRFLKTIDIALLDDSITSQLIILNIFERYGVTNVDVFSHPRTLLKKKKPYHLYLIDLVMPEVSGEEVIQELRVENPHSVIIAISGISNEKTISHVLLSGADDYLTKPFDRNIFMARIRASVRTYQLLKELEERKQELQILADTDSMTRLYNHRFMYTALESLRHAWVPDSSPPGILLMDIDNFKAINDTYGHPEGDLILTEFARRIRYFAGTEHLAGRYGGEEFLIIFPSITQEGLESRAKEVLQIIREVPMGTQNIPVRFSGGAASFTTGMTTRELVSLADERLYQAKEQGKDRVIF